MSGPLTIAEVLRRSRTFLAERGSASPRLDAELLLAHALGVDRLRLYTDSERPLTPAELTRARELVGRRGRREPVAYLTGERGFRRLRIGVGPGVLVPRPETELLVDWALEVAAPGASVLDWGTGSGAIALALADEGDALRITAIDRSPEALAIARANAERTGAEVEWLDSDGFGALAGRRFDVIVANPPYLSSADLAAAPPELGFEPEGALVSGPTGLEAIAAIAREGPDHLAPGGWLLMEVGQGQAEAAEAAMEEAGMGGVRRRKDLAGIERAVGGEDPLSADVAALVSALEADGVVLVPTDTVYGLAAALDRPEGVAALYALKGRPRTQPSQVLVYSAALLDEALALLDPRTRGAADALLPGPATCLVPDPVGRFALAGGDSAGSVGVRAPQMDGRMDDLDLFLVATSANEPGETDPAHLDDVPARLRAAVDAELDLGALPGTASAVVDLRAVGDGGAARLVRPGPDPALVEAALAAVGVPLVRPV